MDDDMLSILEKIICVPFGTILEWIYNFVNSYGLAIVLFTLLTKIIILPFSIKSKRSMAEVQKLQPKIKELEKQYAGTNKQKYSEEVNKLYKEEGVSPTGGCLPMLITFPIMIGLYYVIQRPLSYIMHLSFEQIQAIGSRLGTAIESTSSLRQMEIPLAGKILSNFDKVSDISNQIIPIDFNFLGLDLSLTPSLKEFNALIVIPILACLTAFALSFLTSKMQKKMSGGVSNAASSGSNKVMLVVMPLMSLWFTTILPAGVGIYWITSNILMMIQEYFLSKYLLKVKAKKDAIVKAEEDRKAVLRKAIEEQRRKENRERQMEISKQQQNQKKNKKKGGKR